MRDVLDFRQRWMDLRGDLMILECGHTTKLMCRPGQPMADGDCESCWRSLHDPEFRAAHGGNGPPVPIAGAEPKAEPLSPCVHFGEPTGTMRPCPTCPNQSMQLKEFACAKRGTIVIRDCRKCSEKQFGFARFDHKTLFPDVRGLRFNCSITAYQDHYLFAFRNGWAGSEIFLCELTKDFAAIDGSLRRLRLFRESVSNYGREDPRLFWFRGRLHVMFTGVSGNFSPTHVCYARLRENLTVEKIYAPHYERRRGWEKNWQFFEHEEELYAVYTIAPHRVLKIDGDQATEAYLTQDAVPWAAGEMRGGAPPVHIGDEWWSFFHSSLEPGGKKTYYTGAYAFEARPPFRITRITREPILVGDWNVKPPDQYCAVVFAGGAVRVGDRWIVAHGMYDRWCELHSWNAAAIEAKMAAVPPV